MKEYRIAVIGGDGVGPEVVAVGMGVLGTAASDVYKRQGEESSDWLVACGAGEPGVSRGTGEAGCEVTGPARDLYLTLWNRRQADGLQVTGDPGILAAFTRTLQITW